MRSCSIRRPCWDLRIFLERGRAGARLRQRTCFPRRVEVPRPPAVPSKKGKGALPSVVVLLRAPPMALVKLSSGAPASTAHVLEAPFAVLKVTAAWCGPCRTIHPKYVEVAEACPDVEAFVMDIDKAQQEGNEAQAMLEAANVEYLPTFLAFQGGRDSGRTEGGNIGTLQQLMTGLQEAAARAKATHAAPPPSTAEAREVSLPVLEREQSERGT